jgi:hypothetical protein
MMEKDTNLRYPNYKSIVSDIKKYLSTVPRDRQYRASNIVINGSKKIIRGGQKATPLTAASNATFATSSEPLVSAVPNQSGGLLKKFGAKTVLLVGCLLPLIGVFVYKDLLKKKEDAPRRLPQEVVTKGAVARASTNSQQVAQVTKGAVVQASTNIQQLVQVAKGAVVGKETVSSNQVAQAGIKPIDGKELARGVAKIGEKIQLGNDKGLQRFTLGKGQSLIVAIWSSSEGKTCGDFSPLTFTHVESKKTACLISRTRQSLGSFSLIGLSRGTRFPFIERAEPAKEKVRYKSYMVDQMGISFDISRDRSAWQYSSSKAEHAPAVAFKVNQEGTYSLSGQILVREGPGKGSIEWMVFAVKLE